jgi:PRC-barrel domain
MKENAMEAARETGKLISTDKVAGTNVYNTLGDTLSAIHDLMIDKATGKVAYALMSVGGFLGIGNQYYPLPWSHLKYDTNLGGYVVNLDKRRLEGAPAYDVGTESAGATDLTKARFTTITEWGPTGPKATDNEIAD